MIKEYLRPFWQLHSKLCLFGQIIVNYCLFIVLGPEFLGNFDKIVQEFAGNFYVKVLNNSSFDTCT